jgi:hypothetical protein
LGIGRSAAPALIQLLAGRVHQRLGWKAERCGIQISARAGPRLANVSFIARGIAHEVTSDRPSLQRSSMPVGTRHYSVDLIAHLKGTF